MDKETFTLKEASERKEKNNSVIAKWAKYADLSLLKVEP